MAAFKPTSLFYFGKKTFNSPFQYADLYKQGGASSDQFFSKALLSFSRRLPICRFLRVQQMVIFTLSLTKVKEVTSAGLEPATPP